MIICLLHRSCNYLQKRVITFYPKKGNNYVTLLKFDNHHFKKMIMYKGQLNSSDMLYMNFFFNICTQKKTINQKVPSSDPFTSSSSPDERETHFMLFHHHPLWYLFEVTFGLRLTMFSWRFLVILQENLKMGFL